MKLRKIGPNTTEITTSRGAIVLYSYSTPVAAFPNDGRTALRTNRHYSKTTSKHINQWLGSSGASLVDQSVIDALV